jgi:histidinol phosphatase-like PHP family hydrolase
MYMNFKGPMDLHNHTFHSDGYDSPEKIIKNAVKNGIKHLGITDHFYTSKTRCSIKTETFGHYLKTISEYKEKYKNQINTHIGVEICMDPYFTDLENFPFDKVNKLDYILLEYLDLAPEVDLRWLRDFCSQITCSIGLAHTNLFTLFEWHGREEVLDTLSDLNIFWELNVQYQYYIDIVRQLDSVKVNELFEDINKYGIKVTVGSDTHSLSYYSPREMKFANELVRERFNR